MKRHSNLLFHNSLYLLTITALSALGFFSGCDPEDPSKEDVPELITKVTLTFTPTSVGSVVIGTATDPDGSGVQLFQPDGTISLVKDKQYKLTISIFNTLADPSAPEYNLTDEIEEEGVEHMLFFSWTNDVFFNPLGNGNIDNRSDAVNYLDEDANGLPLGLETSWFASDAVASGAFRVLLKHQPDLKSGTSGSSEGETDLDISFNLSVVD